MNTRPIPVILDTDIGTDIDDTWALALALRSPEIDLRLVVSGTGDARYRAALAAKTLQIAGREDVAVGVGLDSETGQGQPQADWLADWSLGDYRGVVHADGIDAMVRAIMEAPDPPVTLLAIGPVPNVAEALRREPRIAERARFVGMHGCLRRSFLGSARIVAEYNVAADPAAFQRVIEAPWPVVLTPLDTCGQVVLEGPQFQAMRFSDDPLARAVIENYRCWAAHTKRIPDSESRSSILFDTVAVHLVHSERFLEMSDIGLAVTDDGFTRETPAGRRVRVATEWSDLAGFRQDLVWRLTGRDV